MDFQKIFQEHSFELSHDEMQKFQHFLQIFQEYNSHTNLSAIRDKEGIIEKHFVDSLYGVPILQELGKEKAKILDIGSGGGFPGIPLKIVLPDLDITLLDSVGKKVRAMNFFVETLELQKITAIQERAEKLVQNPKFSAQYDIVVSRATAYIDTILLWGKPFLKKGGKILLYKMPSDEENKSREKIVKKLGLRLEGEFSYFLGGKSRIIYIFGEKSQKNVGQVADFS